jgi:hypothetical protein
MIVGTIDEAGAVAWILGERGASTTFLVERREASEAVSN